jgi:hypothetical protein
MNHDMKSCKGHVILVFCNRWKLLVADEVGPEVNSE